jgi:calcineurin-like phosphoesterase family protein
MSMIRKYTIEQKVWLMSDLHIGHDREFVYEKRGFQSIEEHNQTLIENIKACVGENDDFYILGDLTLGDLDAAAALLRQIPGHVHVILGNHDTDRRVEFYESLGWDVQFATVIRYGKQRFYLSHYPTDTANPGEDKLSLATLSVSGHTHSNSIWQQNASYNVCPEAHNNRPVSIEKILSDFMDKYVQKY